MHVKAVLMFVFVAILASIPAVCQVAGNYQQGMITGVVPHATGGDQADNAVNRYDITITVGNTSYTVLHTVPKSRDLIKLAPGMDLPVLVEQNTLVFSSKGYGLETRDPILRRDALPGKRGIDWSRTAGEYFYMQFNYLSDSLRLNAEQRTKLKPILEQESGEVAQINLNPVLSRHDKLKFYREIVRSSDKKMTSFLSQDQRLMLMSIRAEQYQELGKPAASGASNRRND